MEHDVQSPLDDLLELIENVEGALPSFSFPYTGFSVSPNSLPLPFLLKGRYRINNARPVWVDLPIQDRY